MRILPALFLAVLLPLTACGGPTYRWDRAGATEESSRADQVECRRAAASEAFRQYVYEVGFPRLGPQYWGYQTRPEYFAWRQRLEAERFFYEHRLANFCMRNKGYELVPVPNERG